VVRHELSRGSMKIDTRVRDENRGYQGKGTTEIR
jgi:hypothetical protein